MLITLGPHVFFLSKFAYLCMSRLSNMGNTLPDGLGFAHQSGRYMYCILKHCLDTGMQNSPSLSVSENAHNS